MAHIIESGKVTRVLRQADVSHAVSPDSIRELKEELGGVVPNIHPVAEDLRIVVDPVTGRNRVVSMSEDGSWSQH